MKTFKFLTLSFILLLSIINISNSQTKDSSNFSNYLKPGKWAVQFELGTFINPTYFKSVEIAFKPQLSNSSAFRLGISVNMRSISGTTTENFIEKPGQNKYTDLGASLNYIHYLNPAGRVCFYLGIGPVYQYTETRSDYISTSTSSGLLYIYENHGSSREWTVGGTGILGVEWFLLDRISLMAEYNLVYKMGKSVNTQTDINSSMYFTTTYRIRNEDMDVSEFKFNIVKLGLSAYF